MEGMNCAAVMILCLQETKLTSLIPPAAYTVVHSVQQKGEGIVMLAPQSLPTLQSTIGDYHVHAQVAVGSDVLHIFNCYLPPSCPYCKSLCELIQLLWLQLQNSNVPLVQYRAR